MATTPANLMQTSVNAATTLVSAYVQAGFVSSIDEAKAAFEAERASIFAILSEQPGEPVSAPTTRVSGGPTKGRGKQFTAEEARGIALNFGKFKGVTLGELENLTGAECAEYGYGDGEKTGLQYLKYLANNDDPKADYMRRASTAVLDDRRSASA